MTLWDAFRPFLFQSLVKDYVNKFFGTVILYTSSSRVPVEIVSILSGNPANGATHIFISFHFQIRVTFKPDHKGLMSFITLTHHLPPIITTTRRQLSMPRSFATDFARAKPNMRIFCLSLSLYAVVASAFVSRNSRRSFYYRSDLAATKLDGRPIAGPVAPLNNFLLVKKKEAVDKTQGGILLTGKAKIVKTEGTVVAVGPGRVHHESGILIEMPVEKDEGVVYGKFDGTEIDLDGEKHVLIRDDDILVKFKGSELTLETVETVRDNILVSVNTEEEETEGGILIAASSKKEKRPSTGEVVKVGPGKMASNGEIMPMEVAIGDMVKFRDFAGNEVEIEGKEYSVVKMADVLAKF